jgi:hypothetical protein
MCLPKEVVLFLCSLSGPPLKSVIQAERCSWLVRWLQQGQSGCALTPITTQTMYKTNFGFTKRMKLHASARYPTPIVVSGSLPSPSGTRTAVNPRLPKLFCPQETSTPFPPQGGCFRYVLMFDNIEEARISVNSKAHFTDTSGAYFVHLIV